MSPQLYFFVSVGFSLVAWGIVAARYIWPRLRDRQQADALRPLLNSAQLPLRGPGVPRSGRRLARSAGRLRAFRRLRRFHRRDAGVAHVGVAVAVAQDWRRRRMDLQSLGRGRSSQRVLSGQRVRAGVRATGRRLLHSDRLRAAAADHPRPCVPDSVATPGSVGRDGKREPGLNSSTTSVTAPTRRRGRRELTGATP